MTDSVSLLGDRVSPEPRPAPTFTREDVLTLREAARLLRVAKDDRGQPIAWPGTTSSLDDIADRIASLLPPEPQP